MKRRLSVFLVICYMLIALCGCNNVSVNPPVSVVETEKSEITTSVEGSSETIEDVCGDIKVHFLDVGQGDCEFIELPNGQTMLIDAGENDDADTIINYIRKLQYETIDYVIATHPHSDHIGGMDEVLNSFRVSTMYMPEKTHTTRTFENMLDAIENNHIELHRAKNNVNILTNGILKIDILAPFDESYEDLNNYSAVVKITYGETDFLFMGDAEAQVEAKLFGTDINAEILKVGHHGSDSSSTELFIKEVSPEYAIISCGADNEYGHPHSTPLSMLNDYGANIYRTDEVGTITITADEHSKITIDKKASTVKENAPPKEVARVQVVKEQENRSVSVQVYRTRTGECYHLSSCRSLSKSKILTTISEAKSMGLQAYKLCQPPK